MKVAAKRIGVTVDEYATRRANGLKWCTACKQWHPVAEFPRDRSRGDGWKAKCLKADHGKPNRNRDPLKEAARSAVEAAVRYGRLPHASIVPCSDCGHVGPDRRHERDHVRGYEREHWLDVEVVCTLCHADREKERRRG